jgi:hypothetical protein
MKFDSIFSFKLAMVTVPLTATGKRGIARKRGGYVKSRDEAALRAYLEHVRRNPACVRLAEEVR